MPGIVGVIHKDPGVPAGRATIDAMVKGLRHEPFYASGTFQDETLGLSVGWVSHPGSFSDGLPFWNETKDICLVYSGEDVAVVAEVPALKSRGHQIDGGAAGALVHWYEEMGEPFLRRLNGCFSGLLFDRRTRRILLFNDRFGLGRIYYYENDSSFYFASEAKALLRALPELRALDLNGLAELLAFGCPLDHRTVFSKVRLLPGGSKWSFGPGSSPEKGTYFGPEDWEKLPALSEKDYAERFLEVFPGVVERYFRGPQTVGISLTGGIDTRMIMAWAPCLPFKRPCYTFSGVLRECADVKIARKVARACQQRHETIRISKDFFSDFPALAKRTVLYTDGTMDVSGAPELYMNKKAREIAPVRLTGNYGDQLIRGVVGFKPLHLRAEVFEGQFGTRLAELGRTPLLGGQNPLSFFCAKQLPWFHYPRYAVESSQLTVRSPFLDNDLVSLAFQAPPACRDLRTSLRFIAEGDRALARIPTDMGVTFTSAPLLGRTRRLVQTFTKKAEYAYDYGMPRWLSRLDRALAGLRLENLFLGRHKYYHFRTWYRRELQNYVKGVLLDPRTLQRPYLNGPYLEKMVQAHLAGRDNFTQEIHWLLTSELIQRLLIEKT
jgi:asparagine synthase (glutamine-hydrolysing)